MFGGIPAFGGHSLSGSIERSATLTAKDSRLDMESETFLVHPDVIGALTSHAFSGGAGGRPEGAAAGHFIAVAPTLTGGSRKSGGYSYDDVPYVAATLDASYGRLQGCSGQDANHGHSHLVVHGTQDPCVSVNQAHTLGRNNGQENAVLAYSTKLHHTSACGAGKWYEEYTASLDACSPPPALLSPSQVRRLIPRECERLQGMPDDYTLIPWRGKPAEDCPDGPRYKAIGNSKAVTVVRWIGRRILQQISLDQ
jgi:DNA (cytosine-5)-methyltransferase 1